MTKIVIFGAGDIARLAKFYFETDSADQVVAFTVDRAYLPESREFHGLPIVAFEDIQERYPPAEYKIFIALSYSQMNRVREKKFHECKAKGYQLHSYVSSRCSMLTQNPLGENCFILEDNTVQPFVTIGDNVTLWSGNHIGHDSTIKSHTFISSHVVVSGNVVVGERCFIGVNATLRNSITIGDDCLIAAGAAIMQSTAPRSVWLAPKSNMIEKTSDLVKL